MVGGLALAAHGYGRLTQAVDIVISLGAQSVRSAFTALGSRGYHLRVPVTPERFADPEQRARWIAEKGMTVLNCHSDPRRDTPVDLFVSEPFDFDDEYAAAVVEHLDPGLPVRFLRLAALIRLKEAAGRLQDLADVAELRLLHGDVAGA